MRFPYRITNESFLLPYYKNNAYEVWYWKLNPVEQDWSFWFRFTLLKNATKNVAEIWGIFSKKEIQEGNSKALNIAIKETFPIEECYSSSDNSITLHDNYVNFHSCHGQIKGNNEQLVWDLSLMPVEPQESYNFVPFLLWETGIVKNYAVTIHEKILFNGTIRANQETLQVNNALGMQGHLAGLKQGHSWAWAHSCIFVDEDNGESVPIIIDILTARARIGGIIVSPPLTTLYLYYEGKSYPLNSIQYTTKNKSKYIPLFWEFSTSTDNIQLYASIEADISTVVGVKYEDTDSSELYCYNTKMATMKLIIYDKEVNKKRKFISLNKCAFEWVQRELWEKVPISIW
ncbi:MAG: hypothetical protein ACP5UA_08880 [Candidatus Hydrogenedens sp.]